MLFKIALLEGGKQGFPFDHRIDRFEEAFTIISTLLRDGAIDFDGTYFQLTDARCQPAPVQAKLPIWIGGGGETLANVGELSLKGATRLLLPLKLLLQLAGAEHRVGHALAAALGMTPEDLAKLTDDNAARCFRF